MLDAEQSFPSTFLWSNGESTSSIMVTAPGLYSVQVTTPCWSVSDEVIVYQQMNCEPFEIYVPNIFSPNGDQINDYFSVSLGGLPVIKKFSASIFDRWGNLIFQSEDIHFNWDGTYRNSPGQSGVYVYVLNIDYHHEGLDQSEILKGEVTLLR